MISFHFKHAGLSFRLTQQVKNIAIFEGVSESGRKQWEVHVLRTRKTHPSSSEAGKKVLSRPSTSDWGKYGFTYQSLEKAQEKMDALVMEREKKAKPKANQHNRSTLD